MSLDAAYADLVAAAVETGIARAADRIAGPRRLAWTVPEVARSLGTSPDTVRRLVEDGRLPLVPHVGRRQLIPVAALEAFVLGQRIDSTRVPSSPSRAGAVDGPAGTEGTGTPPPAEAGPAASPVGGSMSPLPPATGRGAGRPPNNDTAPGADTPGAA